MSPTSLNILATDSRETGLPLVKALVHERIEQVDFEQAKTDVMPFIRDVASLELWSTRYFHDLTEQLLGTTYTPIPESC